MTEWLDWIKTAVRRRFARDVGALTVANGLAAGIGFLQGILIARWLGPRGFGLAALVMSYPAFIMSVLSFRSGQGTIKYLGEFSSTRQTDRLLALCRFSYAINLAVAVVALIVVAATGRWIETSLLRSSGSAWLLIAYTAAFVPSSFAEASIAIFSTLRQFLTLAWVRVAFAVLRAALVVVFILAGAGVAGVIAATAITLAVRGVVLLVLAHRAAIKAWGTSWVRAPFQGLAGRWREVLGFFLYTNLNGLVSVAVKHLDVLALGYFQGPAVAGSYNLAKAFGTAVGTFGRTLQTVIYPRFAALWGSGRITEFRRTLRRAALGVGLPLAAGSLLGLPLVPVIVPLVVGPKYASAVPIVAVSYVMIAMSLGLFWLRPWFLSTGRVREWLGLNVANSVFALVAFPLSAAYGGGLGVALMRLAGRLLRNGGAVWIVARTDRRLAAATSGPALVPVPGIADPSDVEVS